MLPDRRLSRVPTRGPTLCTQRICPLQGAAKRITRAGVPCLSPYRPLRPCRSVGSRFPVTAAAATPVATTATSMPGAALFRAYTGVPLLDIFRGMTIAQGAANAAALLAATLLLVVFGNVAAKCLSDRLGNLFDPTATSNEGTDAPRVHKRGPLAQLIGVLISSVERPLRVLLPWFGTAFFFSVLSAYGQVTLSRLDASTKLLGQPVVGVLCELAQIMTDAYEFALIIFATWWFIAFKDRLVARLMESTDHESGESDLARIVYPLSSLITWACITAATLASLVAFGFNIRPLLTLGSVSTLAIGFAAQSTVANIVSALSLYTSRPFIRGDQIILQTMSGSTVVKGTVEQILPMQTIITTDAGHPMFVHNKDVASSYLIINTSRQKQASAKSSAQHALDTTITVRYCDVDATLPIMKEITRVLKTNPNLRQDVSCGCSLKEFSLLGPVLSIKCTLNRDAASRKSLEFAGIMLEAERVVRKHGAFLATQIVVPLPPTLVEEGTAT